MELPGFETNLRLTKDNSILYLLCGVKPGATIVATQFFHANIATVRFDTERKPHSRAVRVHDCEDPGHCTRRWTGFMQFST